MELLDPFQGWAGRFIGSRIALTSFPSVGPRLLDAFFQRPHCLPSGPLLVIDSVHAWS